MEDDMPAGARSLKCLAHHWLAPGPSEPIRVREVRRKAGGVGSCVVRVEASKLAGNVEMLFFRHKDGFWYVFPPSNTHPCMSYSAA